MMARFRILLGILFALWTADALLTIYAVNQGLVTSLIPSYHPLPEAFFFIKGLGLGILAVMAYELRDRNAVLVFKGLKIAIAILSAVVVWNAVNIAISVAICPL